MSPALVPLPPLVRPCLRICSPVPPLLVRVLFRSCLPAHVGDRRQSASLPREERARGAISERGGEGKRETESEGGRKKETDTDTDRRCSDKFS